MTPSFDNPRISRLVALGSVIVDQMMTVPALPTRGGDVMGGPVIAQAGGTFNVIAAAARLGLPTALAGHVGVGLLGDIIASALGATGTELLLPRATGGDSGCCMGFIEPDGERTFVTSPGIESSLTDEDLAVVTWLPGDALYVTGYDLLYPTSGPAIARLLERMAPATLLLDPGPLIGDIPREVLDPVLAHTTALSLSAAELAALGEVPDRRLGLWPLLPADASVLVRVGAAGVWVHQRDADPVHIPAFPTAVVDTTGAGDAHAGALLASLADGLDIMSAARRANAAASFAVGRLGSATGPATEQLDRILHP